MLRSNVPRLATSSPLSAVAVIPSRYGAERFPGKPLHPIAGIPMVIRVLERALQARRVSLVLVATDDERIARAVETAGGRAVMTDPALPSGTDRVWAAVKDLDGGRRPQRAGRRAADGSREHRPRGGIPPRASRVSAGDGRARHRRPGRDREPEQREGRARRRRPGSLLFARGASLPTEARARASRRSSTSASTATARTRSGAGRACLRIPLERAESLEQLRALAAGMAMAVLDAASDSIGVDTIEGRRGE